MRILKIVLSSFITIALVYSLNRSWNFGKPIPPLGKFLDPFHGFWKNAESKNDKPADVHLKGLTGEVSILYDSAMIPHIYATNEEDLFFAQGYVTAFHRLWQMEFQTHAAAGRISEILGSAAIDFDRGQRRLGMVYAAKNSLAEMEKDAQINLLASRYTEGVNAYIHTLTYDRLPIEYKLLDYAPEDWTPLKSGLLLKYMAKTLNIGDKDFEMTNALKLFGKETLDLLYPDNEKVGDPIVDNPNGWKFKPVALEGVAPATEPELVQINTLEKSEPDIGSNNWAVAGSKTASGSPILCNDPHLELNLPSIWYIIHMNAPGYNAMGASLPGSPCVISGFNDSIAWGETNAQRDLVDWFKIKFKDKSKNEYLSDGNWKKTNKVIEKIIVKNASPYYDTVVYTHQGPITYDETFHADSEKKYYAFRWVAHDPSKELITFYLLNKSKNHGDYMKALDNYSSPAQNFVFASVSGDIAMRIQGKYPVRRKDEGKFVLDGTKTFNEWQAFIPNDQNVMYKNPARGFVSSANQYPTDETYPYYVTAPNFEAYRNRRINQRLGEMSKITPQDMMSLQADNYNLKASESLPSWLALLDPSKLNAAEKNAYEKLKSWDYFNQINSEGASYYEAWLHQFFPMIWDEIENSKIPLPYPTSYTTIKLIKEKPDLRFFDIQSTPEKETITDVARKSFSESVEEIEKWKKEKGKEPTWAAYKDSYIQHLARLEPFSYHVIHGGNGSIVNAHGKRNGPSWRMVVSLEKSGVRAWGVYPGGQSGNPGSPYYNSMLDVWTADRYLNLHFNTTAPQMQNFSFAHQTLKSDK
ncbi:MAG: penicillin acylase family protein [Bacteroidetes bacterium]|nr:penicillin acylase family protein [Bacteroidota bacterium]MBS1539773.1 penicillin acylase family protein [Bacteroidota bacterium]